MGSGSSCWPATWSVGLRIEQKLETCSELGILQFVFCLWPLPAVTWFAARATAGFM